MSAESAACLGLYPGMSFEEIVEFYDSQSWTHGRKVTRRSEVPNTDRTLQRGATCMCGYCGETEDCVCGEDRVGHGRDCYTCGRPWWCER